MNIHKNARLSLARRIEMVQEMTLNGLSACAAASAYGVTAPTVRKWLGRYLALGKAGLFDASSRPACSPRAIAPAKALAIVELRHKRLTQARIAAAYASPKARWDECWPSPVSRVWRTCSQSSPSCAMSTMPQARCCTSTPRSSAV